MTSPLLHWRENDSRSLVPTTLSQLGKSETFLEDILFENPDLLGLDDGIQGIRGPFRCWRQVSLRTPDERIIFPDIVAIAASGHLIVVEVKLGTNDELRSRKVISQIVDYAASFAATSRNELLDIFQSDNTSETTWEEFVGSLFPESNQVAQTAALLEQRIHDGELNLVIACDYSPLGTRELLRGVAVQSSLGFHLDLIEITPHINEGDPEDIVFVPRHAATTEIISRTAVTVTIEEGAAQPGVVVESTSLEEIEDRLVQGKQRRDQSRKWTPEEIEEVFAREGSDIERKMLAFCKEHSFEHMFCSPGRKKTASIGFHVPVLRRDGSGHVLMAFTMSRMGKYLWLYFRFREDFCLGETLNAEYLQKLNEAFQNEIDTANQKEMAVERALVEKHLDSFCAVLLWLKETLEQRHAAMLEDPNSA